MARRSYLFCIAACIIAAGQAAAFPLQVTVTNNQTDGGFYFTPTWVGFHDGGFDLFDSGSPASSELEALAEGGDLAPLRAIFGANGDGTARVDSVVLGPNGFPGAPVFDPGESSSLTVDVTNSASNRYLSFGSMVIPSNDAFFGNGDPTAYEIFDAAGQFNGPVTIEIFGSSIYDSGTEVNDGLGAAFSAIGGTDSDEMGSVGLHQGLSVFVGTDTAAGTTIGSDIQRGELLATIQVADPNTIPEPTSSVVWGFLGLMGLSAYRARWMKRILG